MKNTYNAIDLFSGAGGLHIGFEKAGFGIKLCIDNDNLVERTHVRNFPNIPMINRDIREVSSNEIASYLPNGKVDVIIGGPPCQGFSTIGKRVSSDPEKRYKHDPRNELVLTYAKLIRELRPKFIVMETSKAFLLLTTGHISKMYCACSKMRAIKQNSNLSTWLILGSQKLESA